jgi:hypothetical protein
MEQVSGQQAHASHWCVNTICHVPSVAIRRCLQCVVIRLTHEVFVMWKLMLVTLVSVKRTVDVIVAKSLATTIVVCI